MNIRSPYIQGQGAQVGSEQLQQQQAKLNTSPTLPPIPQSAPNGGTGIETARVSDNI